MVSAQVVLFIVRGFGCVRRSRLRGVWCRRLRPLWGCCYFCRCSRLFYCWCACLPLALSFFGRREWDLGGVTLRSTNSVRCERMRRPPGPNGQRRTTHV